MIVQELITRSLKDLQIVQAGETPSNEDSADALLYLNDFIDGNKLLSGLIYTQPRITWTLGSAASYTVGPQGTIDMARPTSPADISTVAYYDTNIVPNVEITITLFTDDQYQAIALKTLTSVYPLGFYYDATFGASGWGTLTPWPVPTSSSLRGVIYARQPIDEFTSLTQTIYLSPGYRRFFRSNLAVEMAAAFGVPVPQDVRRIATDSKRDLNTSNQRMSDLGMDSTLAGAGLYDIWSDTN